MIEALKGSGMKQKSRGDADQVAVLTAWHRVDCRTREAFRRSFLPELIIIMSLMLCPKIPFQQLYNLVSVTVTQSKGTETLKMTRIRKKKAGDFELPNMVTLCNFLRMAKEGIWLQVQPFLARKIIGGEVQSSI
ncbi:unnamed protein product [Coffea canephora]|uniref:Uncharacterized protein n=1 Tax=Coffea canephora TaxID=49390 RepID=A0A068U656_COFCA|nr:unnamed protein product [Coffea canephora]